jgi:hypothetical protein
MHCRSPACPVSNCPQDRAAESECTLIASETFVDAFCFIDRGSAAIPYDLTARPQIRRTVVDNPRRPASVVESPARMSCRFDRCGPVQAVRKHNSRIGREFL